MNRRVLIAIAVVVVVLALVTVVTAVANVRTSPSASDSSLAALSAWSAYVQALATVLLVTLAVPAAYVAISDLRTKRRPVVSVAQAVFEADGVRVLLENVGETSWLRVEIRAWVKYLSPALPTPAEWADGLLAAADSFQRGAEPTFVGTFNALGVSQRRWELLRWGPKAGDYDPAWSGLYGIILWDSTVHDLYGRSYTGSGHTDTEPPSG